MHDFVKKDGSGGRGDAGVEDISQALGVLWGIRVVGDLCQVLGCCREFLVGAEFDFLGSPYITPPSKFFSFNAFFKLLDL